MVVELHEGLSRIVGDDSRAVEVLLSVLAEAPLGIALFEPCATDMRVVYANEVFEALKSFGPMVGHTYSEIWPEVADFALPRLMQVAETGREWVESDRPLKIETQPGHLETRYYTYRVSRLEIGGKVYVLDVVSEATSEVRAKGDLAKELERTRILKETANAAAVLDAASLGRRVLETLRKSLAMHSGVLYLLTDDRSMLRQIAMVGYPESVAPFFETVLVNEETISGQAILHDRLLTFRPEELPAFSTQRAEAAGETGRRWVVTPVHARGKIVGNLTLVFPGGRDFSETELELFRSLGDEIGIALENSRLYEREREASRLGQALAHIDQDTHSSLEVDEVVIASLAEGAKAVGADSAAIEGIEDGVWVAWYDWGFDESIVGHTHTNKQNLHGMEAARTGSTIAIDDAFTDPRVDNKTMKAYGLRSVIVAPLIVRGQVIAALYYNYHDTIHHFTHAEIDFVGRVAASLSLAVENARLYESERNVADRLQEALLSVPAEIPGAQFAYAYHSAAEAARVGGDFYDIFEMGGDLLGVTVGDVAGKGLEAAVMTSFVKNTIRAHASEKGAMPGRILALTNDLVFENTLAESFVTVFFGVLDRLSGRLLYSSAGHTTGALIAAGSAPEELPATGPLLGAFRGMEFGESEMYLDLDDEMLLYTDGLTEARSDHELFGEARLFELLREVGLRPPAETIREVVNTVMRFSDGQLDDDLALFAVRRIALDIEPPPSEKVGL